jgi:hypothetical protein
VAALFFFTTQDYIVKVGTGQLADNWVALFLLLAYISYYSFRLNKDSRNIFWVGAMLGCSLWTKNEGIILIVIFLLFTIPDLLRHKCLGKLFLGMALPLTAFTLFKIFIAPSNDILAAQEHLPWDKIRDLSRYSEVRRLTWIAIEMYYQAIPYLVIGYFIYCIIEKRKPDVEIWMIILCFVAYLSVYIITPHNIGWHISTSVDRLVFQLIPTLIWIIATRLSVIEIKLPAASAK